MMSARVMPTMFAALATLALMGVLQLQAQELVFTPPQQQPIERYETSWQKNPFILKTAPVVEAAQSFAQDLAIASMYQLGVEATVVVVNTKTRERTILRGNQPAPTGLRVKLASIKDSQKDSSAVVEMGGKEATLRYDTTYLKQRIATANGVKTHSAGQPPKGYLSTDFEPGDPTAIVESVHGVGVGMTWENAPAPKPLPEGYLSTDFEPGDPTVILESVHGVGASMTRAPEGTSSSGGSASPGARIIIPQSQTPAPPPTPTPAPNQGPPEVEL
ncbi:hypothetical protein DES53_11060 [Roseimicrobium gellanilyticum]|uniref:Uncharacterized protein n=1 Tax=Roseimicrobium gellanilyticum TaxID=748857 RepID=A0A366HA35_9BACT|nr:hypothetical protein [Roseimicrobium gellanilyticum]RBP39036.1 hypothetical protein DES53_11060 [Roseimicrobium gellanilyticum]